MNITLEAMPLRQLLDYVEATFRPLTTEKGLRFDVVVAPDVPLQLLMDEQRLRQVLRNLLSNAVKFTERGSVELRIERPQDDMLAFHVVDTGIEDRRGEPVADLRRLPAGRRHHAAGATAAPASACRSAGRSRRCSTARSGRSAGSAKGPRSACTSRCPRRSR